MLVYTMHQKNPIICALDTADLERATTLAKAISGKVAIQLHFRASSVRRVN
ncbi:orotidine 5'-phosphate decarboxylase domain protein [Anaplasma phagocytophilum str. NCH-1]|uniref:Orotidine 5'-phosphate decarboxylase domain protein n=1 Tax=Anaplasma phagocytophilum str. NCH-1 TaxID=1359161 RepID=A0A0F3NDF8_ANAPH|nr:orotidine 5'-phosphate decarboxylase domain protein [Anaplasma phagocytophilum str. NCH-1]